MMEQFSKTVNRHFFISWSFFLLAVVFGIIYSLVLLGVSVGEDVAAFRSLHISLMLYGFVPLMLSFLPFVLFEKDGVLDERSLKFLNIYFYVWYFFLAIMVMTLFFGLRRDLAFYDFTYELNFLLAISGVFYLLAILSAIKNYEKKPLWVNVSLAIVIIAPFALLLLMNPEIGQVEQSVSGPHGDNTLGMSFAIIPIFYLVIKIFSDEKFAQKRKLLWIIPLVGYIVSVAMRNIYGEITYNEEWFFQYLTLFYIPLFYYWLKDAKLTFSDAPALYIAVIAYLVVDVEGNILFIPELRWLFHRNDLIVAHAHIAMGVSLFFLSLAIVSRYVSFTNNILFIKNYILYISAMVIALSLSGFVQAGFLDFDITYLWIVRTLSGIFILFTIGSFYIYLLQEIKITFINIYNLVGFLSDGLGALVLIFSASMIYPLLGFGFSGVYEYVVYFFMLSMGVVHLVALVSSHDKLAYTRVTATVRVIVSAVFFALFLSSKLGVEALAVAFYDLTYALIFFYYSSFKLGEVVR